MTKMTELQNNLYSMLQINRGGLTFQAISEAMPEHDRKDLLHNLIKLRARGMIHQCRSDMNCTRVWRIL